MTPEEKKKQRRERQRLSDRLAYQRAKNEGMVNFSCLIIPSWRKPLMELLNKLKKENKE